VRAQSYVLDRSVNIMAGAARFDLVETGTTAIVAFRADAELTRWLVGDLGMSALRPQESVRRGLTYLVPEAQLQLQLRGRGVRPYVGGGGGFWEAVGPNRKGLSRPTASAAAGVRLGLPYARFGARAEVRARQIGRRNVERSTEITGGFAFHF
jgi:hypothetical protein